MCSLISVVRSSPFFLLFTDKYLFYSQFFGEALLLERCIIFALVLRGAASRNVFLVLGAFNLLFSETRARTNHRKKSHQLKKIEIPLFVYITSLILITNFCLLYTYIYIPCWRSELKRYALLKRKERGLERLRETIKDTRFVEEPRHERVILMKEFH